MESTPPDKNILPIAAFSLGGFAACLLVAFFASLARLAIAGPGEPDIERPALGNMLCVTMAGIAWMGILVSGMAWARKRKHTAAAAWLTVEGVFAVLCLLAAAIVLRDFTFANPP